MTSPIAPGDKVGVVVSRYKGDVKVAEQVVVSGIVLKVTRPNTRANWRVYVDWEDKVKAFIYTGRTDWAYLRDVRMIRRAKHNRKRKD